MKEDFHRYEKTKNEAMTVPTQHTRGGEDRGDIGARISAVFSDLTESERRLAEVVLEAAADLSALTAGELAGRAEVSAATAARFFRRLGYESYADARRAARGARSWGSPLDEFDRRAETGPGDLASHIAGDIENLTRLASQIAPDTLAGAVAGIAAARRVFVVGYRNSAALAGYMRGLLAHLKDDVRLLPLAGQTLAEDLAGLSATDIMIVFGFRRRPAVLRDILGWARAAGTPSVLITDATAARTAHLATIVLRCPNKGPSFFDSYVAPMSLSNHIAAAVAASLGSAATIRLRQIEDLHRRIDPLVASPGLFDGDI
jgi:DNA-binding MurR/RpiR family transcriptional regulator